MRERITELETLVAFQDDTIKTLNDIVARQQVALDRLANRVNQLEEHLKALAPSLLARQTEETPPPHY